MRRKCRRNKMKKKRKKENTKHNLGTKHSCWNTFE